MIREILTDTIITGKNILHINRKVTDIQEDRGPDREVPLKNRKTLWNQ